MTKASRIISLAVVLLLVVLVLPIATAHIARATACPSDVWVAPPPLGNDGNPGTQSQPFQHIQHGIDVVWQGGACAGGTVHVAAGAYHENLLIYGAVNLTGAGAPTTIIDGSGCDHVIEIASAPNTPNIISGFTIQNGSLLSSIWDPAKEQVLYAGIKLPSIKMLQQLFDSVPCGGGIYIGQTHIVTLNDCTIKDNEAEEGGGICNRGQLTMNRCTVSGNSAATAGGGIYNVPSGIGGSGKMWLTNCTISGNSVGGVIAESSGICYAKAMMEGGGIFNAGDMELLNCTIANNSAEDYGGGFANMVFDTATFKNTIVANNTAGAPGTNNCYNPPPALIISLGHNLDSENTCHFSGTGDLVNTDPLLGPLQDNGGPTFTHALLLGSPAIDAGDNAGAPATDQRGITRPQGPSVDIGAYELIGGAISTTPERPRYSPPMPTINRYLNAATMSVQFVSVSPQQVTANQPVTISTNVVNTGDEGGNYNVALKINGQVEQTRMVSVGPQAAQPIKFTVTRAQPGTYSVDIDGQKGSFTIPATGGTGGTPVNGGLIAFLIIGVLVLATVMVLVLSRRPA
jgi:hypothetical protein